MDFCRPMYLPGHSVLESVAISTMHAAAYCVDMQSFHIGAMPGMLAVHSSGWLAFSTFASSASFSLDAHVGH